MKKKPMFLSRGFFFMYNCIGIEIACKEVYNKNGLYVKIMKFKLKRFIYEEYEKKELFCNIIYKYMYSDVYE